MSYWLKRIEREHDAITNKKIEEVEAQLQKYYKNSMNSIISEFEATYDKLLAAAEDGKDPTPADLYKMDRYWQMQANIAKEAQKLGNKELVLLSEAFEAEWKDIYEATMLPSDTAFSTFSEASAKSAINTTWVGDGKNFSKRIWDNTENLIATLNEKMIDCVITGKDTKQLKKELTERFGVSYSRADTLVRTEIAHIQTQAAAQRYQDYGLTYYEFLGRDEHDIGCKCKELNGKQFLYSEMQAGKNAPPMHPNCRCAISPVVNKEMENKIMEVENKGTWKTECSMCGKEFETDSMFRRTCDDCAAKVDSYKGSTFNPRTVFEKDQEEVKNNHAKWSFKNAEGETMYSRQCAHCGGTVFSTQAHGKVYHNDCLREMEWEKENEIVVCPVCGDYFERSRKAANKTMCDDCYADYRRKYKAAKEKERRNKKKN